MLNTKEKESAPEDIVSAESKCPKADGIACPWIARYNGHNLGKEKDASLLRGTGPTVSLVS
jgi:hypothetical protein